MQVYTTYTMDTQFNVQVDGRLLLRCGLQLTTEA